MEVAWAFTLVILGILLMLNLFAEYRLKELLMALADDLNAIEDQLNKAKAEITGKIEALEGALAASGEQTQEVADAVAALKGISQNLDDVVPDVAVEAVDSSGGESVEAGETPAAEALVEALEAAAESE